MENAGYYLLKANTWIIQLFPLRVHYLVSDLLFILAYHILRYRRRVVAKNLANSFPEKTQNERTIIAKKFYRHFCDSFVETLYFDRISVTEGKKCVKFTNPELLNGYLDQGRQVITFFGHYNNWEWFCNLPLYVNQRCYAVYKKLRNKSFDRFYYHLRNRFGAVPLERGGTFRQLVGDQQKGIPSFSAFLFDQTPRPSELHHWLTFMNQDTPVILGVEKIAQKLDTVVLFLFSHKKKRGFYEAEFQLVTDHGSECQKFEITNTCTQLLERQIKDHPEFWLWSHKRWKHSRERFAINNEPVLILTEQ